MHKLRPGDTMHTIPRHLNKPICNQCLTRPGDTVDTISLYIIASFLRLCSFLANKSETIIKIKKSISTISPVFITVEIAATKAVI